MLDTSLIEAMVDLLEPLLREPRQRQNRLDVLFTGKTNRPDIDITGAPRDAIRHIILVLLEYGSSDPGTPALWAFLESVRGEFGVDHKALFDSWYQPIHGYALPRSDLKNPYKGLAAFQEHDADLFFGRDVLVQRLVAALQSQVSLARFLAVVGPSGSGKSSVVKAGLLPLLRQGGIIGSQQWLIAEMVAGINPFFELEAALLRM